MAAGRRADRPYQLLDVGHARALDILAVDDLDRQGGFRIDNPNEPAKVRARTITLNHDAGRWLSIGVPGELPAVVREVNGQWQRQ